ncbi:MAG: T9SS type A sorting domain-containing protein [Flavobacteriales bacterium]|nr:T9SS type A sorting domain-containing protein [Flavobacteriales bacterium]
MKRYLLYTFILTLLALPKQVFAQCDLPQPFTGNTGSNMTVMLTPDFISSLPISTPSTYLVAKNSNGLVIGSEVVSGVSQITIAVWADDAITDEVDGAMANESISFQLVDGDNLYDVEAPTPVTFTANGMSVQSSSAILTLNCQPPVLGCTNENADNYSAEATQDDGSCSVSGCTDENAVNFNPEATQDDNSCIDATPGCTDALACNFNPLANQDDESCFSAEANKDCNGDCINDADNNGTCDEDEEVVCTDENACNYSNTPNATSDNTLCDYPDADSCEECVDGVSVVTLDSDGDGVCDADEISGCLNESRCNYNSNATDGSACSPALKDCETCATDENGDNILEVVGSILVNDDDGDGICNDAEVAGCTNSLSSNYNNLATDDDGSCNVVGCTDAEACNYNKDAVDDNGFCIVAGDCQSCSGETDGTGVLVDDDVANDPTALCDDIYTEEQQGSFSEGYRLNFSTVGTDVIINFELLDDVNGVNAYLWGMNPNFSETSMTTTTDKIFTKTLTNQAIGSTITYACKFDWESGGLAVTKYFDYTVGDLFCGTAAVCDNKTIPGCTDVNACNYDATSNANDGSCTYEGPVLDCSGICLNDVDGDAVCDENEILGCDIPEAENYDDTATENNGSCIVKACMDASACNYNVNATEDDGSCSYPDAGYDCNGDCINDADEDGICDEDEILGCMDNTRCNYDASATDDEGCLPALDGVCETCSLDEDEKPFTDGTGLIVDNDINDNGVCDENEAGCTRPNADNYNPEAIANDGSCLYNGNDACDLVIDTIINTGVNMTVMLTQPFISSLNITDPDAYLVAKSSDGSIVGLQSVSGVIQETMAIWGDDQSTLEIDGAPEGDLIVFQLKNKNILYDVEMPIPVEFITNEITAQPTSAVLSFNCSGSLGCNDPMADNFDTSATIDDGSCTYSPCNALVASDFAIEFDSDNAKPVLTYKVKNTLSDQDFLTPNFELFLYSNTFEFLDTTYYSGATIPRNGSQTISIPLYNDFTEYLIPDSISGTVRVTGSGSIDSLSVGCDVFFDKVTINTDQVGCKQNGSYNYSEFVTIDNGMCVEALSVTIDMEGPICSYDYGSAIIHVTGDSRSIRSNYTSDSLYNWLAPSGAMTMQDSIRFDNGYATLEGLDAGDYVIGIKDSVLVKNDTLEVLSLDTFTITKPDPIEVEVLRRDSLVYSVNQDDVVFQQWLFKGVPLQQDKFKAHYPQHKGLYQVYVENADGCGYYSKSVLVLELGVEDSEDDLFRLYPNPTESELNVDLANLRDDATVVLTDVLGQQLQHLLVNAGSSESTYTFDVSEYPSGLYFLRVNQGRSQLVKRFVKK